MTIRQRIHEHSDQNLGFSSDQSVNDLSHEDVFAQRMYYGEQEVAEPLKTAKARIRTYDGPATDCPECGYLAAGQLQISRQ